MTDPYEVPIVPGSQPATPSIPPTVPPPVRPHWVVPVIVALVVAVLAAGGAVAWLLLKPAVASSAGALTVTGELILSQNNGLVQQGRGCAGGGGFSDIAEGAAVTVTDATGTTVALGRLLNGRFGSGTSGADQCSFSFTVPGVPAGKGFYGVEVSHRGRVQFAETDLARPLALTLG